MAHTPSVPPLTLPISLTVGDYTAEVGQLTLEPGETVHGALSDLLRAAADALDHVPNEEVNTDAPPLR
ncbi:hypothetical protein [Streptomyces sp. NPDC001270]|uniref:hypothetical protein n=1 Tax=Streptomyces sp. NPDC001270 TaxID=3364554 RepID=UPI003675843B